MFFFYFRATQLSDVDFGLKSTYAEGVGLKNNNEKVTSIWAGKKIHQIGNQVSRA